MEERRRVLEGFGIGMEENQRGMVKSMCNLGEGIWERGIEQGRLDKAMEIAAALLDVMDIPVIAQKTGLTEEEIREIQVKKEFL